MKVTYLPTYLSACLTNIRTDLSLVSLCVLPDKTTTRVASKKKQQVRSTETVTMNFSSELLRTVISACVYSVILLHIEASQVFFDTNYQSTVLIFALIFFILEVFHSCIRAIVYEIKPSVIKSVDKSLILRWLTSALYSALWIVLLLCNGMWHKAGEIVGWWVLWTLCSSVINHYVPNIPHQTVWDISLTVLILVSSAVITILFPFLHHIKSLNIYQVCYQLFIYFWITTLITLLYSTRETLRQVRQSLDDLINDRMENSQQQTAPPPSYSEVSQRRSSYPSMSSASIIISNASYHQDDTKIETMISGKGTTSNYENIKKDITETLDQNVKKAQWTKQYTVTVHTDNLCSKDYDDMHDKKRPGQESHLYAVGDTDLCNIRRVESNANIYMHCIINPIHILGRTRLAKNCNWKMKCLPFLLFIFICYFSSHQPVVLVILYFLLHNFNMSNSAYTIFFLNI